MTPNPFHFIHSKASTAQVSSMSTVIFFTEGKHLFWQHFHNSRKWFDTTGCRNRNHNKLGGLFFFAGQGLLAGRLPLCLPNLLSASLAESSWALKEDRLSHPDSKIPVEQSVFCVFNPPPSLKQGLKLFWSFGHMTLYHDDFY